MSRKNENVIPFQTKHLRFVSAHDQADGTEVLKELSQGGFTLAFRLHDLSLMSQADQARWESETGIIVQYSWAECNLDDNFHKKRGRMISMHRLNNQASNWYHEFALELTPDQAAILRLGPVGSSLVDIRGVEKQVAREVIENFCTEQQAYTACGDSLDEFSDYLIEYAHGLALNSDVLLTGAAGEDEDFVLDEAIVVSATEELQAALVVLRAESIDQEVFDRVAVHINAAIDLLNSGIDSDDDEGVEAEEDDDTDPGVPAGDDSLDEDDEATDEVVDKKDDDGEGAGDKSFSLPA